jgi:ketosteroid isomerase-like protein
MFAIRHWEDRTMPRIVETTVYRLDELTEGAKDLARSWYRDSALDHDWYESVLEDFETICGLLGVRPKTNSVSLMGGGARQKARIYFRGFSSQGDGACFEAFYSYRSGAARAVREHAPQDTELHRIADDLQAIQRRNFYQLRADTVHRGHYYHELCMAISVERDSSTYQEMTPDAEEAVAEALRDLARWLYRQLEREYEYLTSDEVIDEAIGVNGYTFTESGRRFG